MFLSLLVGIPSGISAALHRGDFVDRTLSGFMLGLLSLPAFVAALLFLYVFAYHLGLVSIGGSWGSWQQFVLPAVVLSLRPSAVLMRVTRAALLETLNEEYVRTARAKGLPNRTVVMKHAARNAVIPIMTVAGPILGQLMVGSLFVERVFGVPGLGRHAILAIMQRDYPVIMGITLFMALVYIILNLLVDLGYSLVDPRMSLGKGMR